MTDMSHKLAARIGNLVARGTVAAVNAVRKLQALQVRLLADEIQDGLEHFEPYGLTAAPHPGAEAIAVFLDGDRSNGVVVAVSDRRYRVAGLQSGEVAVYDDLGHVVRLTRSGIVIDGGGDAVTVTHASAITLDAPTVRCTGQLVADGDILDNGTHSAAALRAAYDAHHHTDSRGGLTTPPTPTV